MGGGGWQDQWLTGPIAVCLGSEMEQHVIDFTEQPIDLHIALCNVWCIGIKSANCIDSYRDLQTQYNNNSITRINTTQGTALYVSPHSLQLSPSSSFSPGLNYGLASF